ncbi:MAG: PhzF family phenazine biosynthesis protein [Planctomycetota bacterium]
MPKHIPILQIDAFTAEPFRGNPAGVCLLSDEADPAWMQAVAAEMNLSETAFLVRQGAEFQIRWFTPATEVPLCGHATLASAHALWEEGIVAPDLSITFRSQSGPLAARREADWICLDFPLLRVAPVAAPAGLAEALGCAPLSLHRDATYMHVVELESAAAVRDLRPDIRRLHALGLGSCIVTARGDAPGCDFVSRFFAPMFGIDEDPVTGSAHCALAPFWAERLGRSELTGQQVSKRGGVVRVRVRGERVELLGQAVTVIRGELRA